MDDDKKIQSDDCGCGHDHSHHHKLPEDKVEDLKEALKKLGYNIEETEDGDIKVTQ
jgi:hypothetical protein